jgi:hypothetical protein
VNKGTPRLAVRSRLLIRNTTIQVRPFVPVVMAAPRTTFLLVLVALICVGEYPSYPSGHCLSFEQLLTRWSELTCLLCQQEVHRAAA